MRNYETIFILDSVLDDEKVDSITDKYSSFLNKNGSTIINTDKWGRRKFSYPIKKRVTGSYVSIEFTGNPKVVSKLEKTYLLDENILRYLTVSYDKKILHERKLYFEKREEVRKEIEAIKAEAELKKEQSGEKEKSEARTPARVKPRAGSRVEH